MNDGTYRVHFSTPEGAVGGGLVKVEKGVIFGADAGFMYSGKSQSEGGRVTGVVAIQQHSQGQRSVLTNVASSYSVEFAGESTANSFHLLGNLVGDQTSQIGIVGWLQRDDR